MRSCLGMLFTMTVLTAVICGGALLWLASTTAEITPRTTPAVDRTVR